MPWNEVMHKWGKGQLHSGSKTGKKVTSQKQAVAIMLSEKRAAGKGKSEYQSGSKGSSKSSKKSPPKKSRPPRNDSSTPSGALSHRPKPFRNPPTLEGRRELSRQQYGQ